VPVALQSEPRLSGAKVQDELHQLRPPELGPWPVLGGAGGVSKFQNGYGSIPNNTFFSGMNIHLPAILM